MIRVFIAVDLGESTKKELAKFVEVLSSKRWPVRWESIDKLHITLFFIGWINTTRQNLINEAVEQGIGGFNSFKIRMGSIGVFPDYVQPRVVWVGIKGDQPELIQLQKKVAKQLVEAGFKGEKRSWIPHLTIGRVKKDSSFRARKELGRQLRKLESPEFFEETKVSEVVVYESKLLSSRSVYNKLKEIKFPS